MHRRPFLRAAAAAPLAAAPLFAPAAAAGPRVAAGGVAAETPPVGVFTKSFQDWPIETVCERFAELGADGLDLTVRPGGHVEPADAAAGLPAAVRAAAARGLRVLFLTTAVADASPAADRLLGVAADAGVPLVKLGYFRTGGGPLADRLDGVKRTLADIIKLAAARGVVPCVHTHSGDYLPSHGTLLWEVLRDFDPATVGAYVDTLHCHVEGGGAGWRQGLDLSAPWLRLCAVKNYALTPAGRDDLGMKRWKETVVPVADGVCPVPDFVRDLKARGFAGPFSLHSEYRGRGSFRPMTVEETFGQTRADLAFFRGALGSIYS